jgi:hypothetical protein
MVELKAATRLAAAPSNSQGGVQAEVGDQLRKAKYQVVMKGNTIEVHNGTPQNVSALLKNSGWTLKGDRLVHPQLDYYIKLGTSGKVTTLQVKD